MQQVNMLEQARHGRRMDTGIVDLGLGNRKPQHSNATAFEIKMKYNRPDIFN